MAAVVNNRLYGRTYPLKSDCRVEPVTRADRLGWDVYRRSACLMLYEAARRVDPELRLVLSQTLGDGYYFYDASGEPISKRVAERLQQEMESLSEEDVRFEVTSMSVIEARRLFSQSGYAGKVHVLSTHWEPKVRVVWCGGFFDLFHTPVVYSTSAIKHFKTEIYDPGLVLRFPRRGKPEVKGELRPQPKLFATYQETRQWNRILGVYNVGDLNRLSLTGGIEEIVRAAEGFHEKKIVWIADEICRRKKIRLVLIAGPSASGKTTFTKRLGVQLRVNGIRPVSLSIDDFFVDRARTPRDENGDFDFESIDAINLDLLGEVLSELLSGREVLTPVFDFHAGRPKPMERWRPMRLEKDQILMMEGIHGLNEKLTDSVPAEAKYRIYISALTQLCIDDHNRIFTSDTRLMRRVIRDRRYRGYSAAETLLRWPSVRRGENRNIFPFQEQADVMFNSALVYEHAVIKPYVERYLMEVPQDDPVFVHTYRLLRFLRLILPVFRDMVPPNSILREFVGESVFEY
jgi:uridine kinase